MCSNGADNDNDNDDEDEEYSKYSFNMFSFHHKIAFDLKFKPVKRLLDYWIGYVLNV